MFMRNYFALSFGILCSIFNVTHCAYEIIKTPNNFSSSRIACADLGMQQVVIRDVATYDAVKEYLNGVGTDLDIWVGMYWDGINEIFRWSDNNAEVMEHIDWDTYNSEPNCMMPWSQSCSGIPNQNCVRLVQGTFLFRTIDCNPETLYYSLCQTITHCAYDIIKTPTNFRSSRIACANIGMQQVVIRDVATYDAVKEYLNGVGTDRDIWVGMCWDGNKEFFRWSDTNAAVVEHIDWDDGEPNCMTPWSQGCMYDANQNCVRLVQGTFLFRTTNCNPDTLHYSLCQTRSCSLNQQVSCESCPTAAPTSPVLSQSLNQTTFQDSLFKINKKETGSYRRQHTSAYDGRLSSRVIGLTGATILVIVCSLFLAADMSNLSRYKQELKQRRGHKRN